MIEVGVEKDQIDRRELVDIKGGGRRFGPMAVKAANSNS
jgi:hypothetical protein